MSTQQSAILADFDTTVRQWIAYLDDYTLEQLSRQPQPQSWSLGQVYIHIISETGYYISQVKAALQDRSHSDQHMHDDAQAMLANNSFPDMQLETPAEKNLPQPTDKEVLRQELLALLQQVDAITATENLSLSAGKAPHPGLHYLTALEWLQLAAMHLRHHFRQKARIDAVLTAGT